MLRKELRQLLASRSAVATAVFTPFIMLTVAPCFMAVSTHGAPTQELPKGGFGIIGELSDDPTRLGIALLPLMVAMTGLLVPLAMSSYLLIIERERRTLELLIALPVRVEQVVRAKLLAVLSVSSIVTFPLLAFDMIFFPWVVDATVADVIALPVLLLCALGYSTAASILLALLARDLRTANNVAGAIIVPSLVVTLAAGALLPGGVVRPLGIAALFLVAAVVVGYVAVRSVTYERLLS